tara:strand:- start:2194 stop:2412 length:219 start_codon:yes stop_codon:yes gene_type:complete
LPPTIIFGTFFSDLFFGLRLDESFEKVLHTKSNMPEQILPLFRDMSADTKYFVIEYPERFLYLLQGLPDKFG